MKFVKNNWMMLFLVILLITGETIHLIFEQTPFNFNPKTGEQLYYNAPVYYLINQFGMITFIPSIFIFMLTPKIKRASRLIGVGIILWNTKELLEEVFYILKWDYKVFSPINVAPALWGQIAFILGVVLLGFIGFKRWRY